MKTHGELPMECPKNDSQAIGLPPDKGETPWQINGVGVEFSACVRQFPAKSAVFTRYWRRSVAGFLPCPTADQEHL
jgi:hypothetical protein